MIYICLYLDSQILEKVSITYWVPNTFEKSNKIVTKSSLNFSLDKGLYLCYPLFLKDGTFTVMMIFYSGYVLH